MLIVLISDGRYIYTTQSSSYLVGPLVTLRKNSTYCLSFSYFFFGKFSSLSVFFNQSQPYMRSEWQRLSDDKSVGKWNSGEIFVPAFGALQVTFAVEFGSGLAIDDISLMTGFCSGGQHSLIPQHLLLIFVFYSNISFKMKAWSGV